MSERKSKILLLTTRGDQESYYKAFLPDDIQLITEPLRAQASEMHGRIKKIDEASFSTVILDLNQHWNELSNFCQFFKRDPDTKLIHLMILLPQPSPKQVVTTYQWGADDVLLKPFDYQELLGRMRARWCMRACIEEREKVIHQHDISLNIDRRDVFYKGQSIAVTDIEFDLIRVFLENKSKPLSRKEIYQKVWPDEVLTEESRTIDVHVKSLRKKVPYLKKTIRAIYGFGYMFEPY